MILPGKGFYSGNKDRDYQRSFQGKLHEDLNAESSKDRSLTIIHDFFKKNCYLGPIKKSYSFIDITVF